MTRKISNSRPNKKLPDRNSILIVCEGEKTEPNYFEDMRNTSAIKRSIRVKIKGVGFNTVSLVHEAIRIRNEQFRHTKRQFEEVWVVFDKDDYSDELVSNAFALSQKEKINVAFSNESFELWYLLHFTPVSNPIPREDCDERLSECIGDKYDHSLPGMYNRLIQRQKEAIKRAKQLETLYDENTTPSQRNPYTTVHKLVERLNGILEIQ